MEEKEVSSNVAREYRERKKLVESLKVMETDDVSARIAEESGRQRTRELSQKAKDVIAERERIRDAKEAEEAGVEVAEVSSTEVVEAEPNPYAEEIRALAKRTPEVRFTKAAMVRPFTDDELKVIAAALKTDIAIYRIADTLHCSRHKIENAIRDVPILSELAKERMSRRKERAQEAVDDCVKQRVPAVVMWNAEKILPEIYGSQVNIDNEDDTRLVIGALPESEVDAADAEVEKLSHTLPDVDVGAVADALAEERGAEMAAAGGGIPVSPLSEIPPAPALDPRPDDPRFGKFVGASEIGRVQKEQPQHSRAFQGGYGDIYGGDDDFGGGDGWI